MVEVKPVAYSKYVVRQFCGTECRCIAIAVQNKTYLGLPKKPIKQHHVNVSVNPNPKGAVVAASVNPNSEGAVVAASTGKAIILLQGAAMENEVASC